MSEAVVEGAVEGAGRQVFSPRNAVAIILVGVFAFSAFVALLAFAPDLQRDIICRANVYSKCAIGFAGLEDLVQQSGTTTLVSRTDTAGHSQGLMIVTLEAGGDSDVAGLRFGGPILVILPKWKVTPDPAYLRWGRKDGLVEPGDMPQKDAMAGLVVARRSGVATPRLTGAAASPLEGVVLTPGPIDQIQTLTAKDWIPILTDETGKVIIAQIPSTRIFVVADPDLFNTQGLANLDTMTSAVTVIRSLHAGDGAVTFDVTLDGYKLDRNPLKLLVQPPFLAVTLCVLGALALVGWQSAFRFGALRRAGRVFALGKEGLTDNSAQLIRLARREAKMAPRYAALTRNAAAKAVGAPRDLTGDALTQFLDRLGRQRGAQGSLADLTAEADRVSDRKSLWGLAQRLYRWRLEMTRERQ